MNLLPLLSLSSEGAPSWSCESEGSGEILYEGMVSDLLSGVLQTLQTL